MSVPMMAAIAGMIVAAVMIGLFVVAIVPPRQRDPQHGMAVGCLMMCSFTMLLPGGLLAWGHFGGHPTMVKVVFWIVVVVAGYFAVMGTSMSIVRARKLRRWRETPPGS
jgi:hypothetical protein